MWITRGTLTAHLVASIAFAAAAVGAAQGAEEPPTPTAAEVWNYLERANYQKNWQFWPGKDALYKGQEPHGMLLTTYVNALALEALRSKAAAMPTGAVIVKENYSPDEELAAVTVMYKAPNGYSSEHNDWFWLKRLPNGEVEASGKVAGCQDCHGASKKRDYLLTPLPDE